MRLFLGKPVRRLVGLAALLFMAIPFGMSVSGCKKALATDYCNAGDSGPVVGQVATITLSPTLATVGESLNYGQIGQSLSASAFDCKDNQVVTARYTYATTSMAIADINPSTGSVCGGTWNRNSGGGIADYTTCTPPSPLPTLSNSGTPVAYVTASAGGATSNSIPIYVHPTVTSIALGNATTNCSTDPATTCCPANTSTVYTPVPPVYTQNSCVSQGATAQLVARVYATSAVVSYSITKWSIVSGVGTTFTVSSSSAPPVNSIITFSGFPTSTFFNGQTSVVASNQTTTAPYTFTIANTFGQPTSSATESGIATTSPNITCQIGHLTFTAPTASNVVAIDQNGVATANQPGSTLIQASVSNSSSASSAGFFSTCPPASITLAIPGSTATTASVNLNNAQPLVATVTDTNGVVLTGINLEFESTTPQTAAGGSSTITPVFPGTAAITAICQPATCNPSPFSQIGYLGNGKPIQSNNITLNTQGSSSSAIYMASTQSQYLLSQDFSTTQQGSPVKLPYVPNSMVISLDGSTLFLGSTQGLMIVTTGSNTVSGPNLNQPGTVLSLSPDGSTLVITDPSRQTISLYSVSTGGIITVIGGVGTRAVWSPDSQTVYVATTAATLLTHTAFTDWQSTPTSETYTDASVMVPSIGAYFAGGTPNSTSGTTDGHSYCPASTQSPTGTPPTETNIFAPLADMDPTITDKLASTNVGQHILGAHSMAAAGASTFSDIQFTYPTQQVMANGATVVTPAACPIPPAKQPAPGYFGSTPTTVPIVGTPAIQTTAITGVFPTSGQVSTSNNEITFVTYTGTGAQLPEYVLPSSGAAGTLTYVPLTGTATAPISGVWSTDNNTFYTGTSGDNQVHLITQSCTATAPITCTWKDSSQIAPALPAATGAGTVPVNLIAQRPKRVTS